ncbi:MAG: efflux RND transporter periplasmic adaptor subunit [Bacillus sp. (in: firmicutes)]
MDKWKKYLIFGLAVAFVGVNLFLLLKEDSKAGRVNYIDQWVKVQKDDVTETFQTKGVVQPEQEHEIYYHEEQGNVSAFSVKEGDVVSAGSALFVYDAQELEDEKAEVEAEIAQTQGELDSIKIQIAELKKLTVPSSSSQSASASGNDQVKVDVQVDVTHGVETDVDKAILEAEAEEEKLEAKLVKQEKQLSRISDKISQTTVTSDVDGQVIHINKDMKNPIITIASTALAVEGSLTEQQMSKAAVQQKVEMYSSLHDKKYEGVIQKIVSYPKEKPSISKEVEYPFYASLAEGDTELLPGSKLSMKVVVDEAIDVPVVAGKSTFKKGKKVYVYQLTDKGTVKKTAITPGLKFSGKQEVVQGIEVGQLIAAMPKEITANQAAFITPMKSTKVQTYNLKTLTKKQMAKYVLMGIFEK